jgi:hypothetical protein
MRQPDNLPAFCRVHRNGRPLIGRSGRPLDEPNRMPVPGKRCAVRRLWGIW